ncbi:helix-turn-helix domain-containing protein [Curtobacterium herbarum]|uniref:HTH araC/xylS-type domain-containing protein n=1 Tax=Curtobacterium herbarum TaxID=150122 RepID=A0ABN1Z8U6_9MICO|nr:AraC family transcriptional regulator [Curtobacterium herbarum]MBM7476348.1 AraC-like DNA-binding protein [Curtobacterium herbarum]MCS6544085.1 AraC family transcriptional regulator [Curtobacterium herbarum]
MPPIDDANGFRKQRFTDAGGSDYTAIFRSEYSGQDLRRDTAVASETYATAGTQYEYFVIGNDDLTLRRMNARGGRRGGVIGPRDDHVVFWLQQGRLEMHFADRTRIIEPGSPYIASASEAYRFESEETVYNGVHISDAFLRKTAGELGYPMPDGPVLFDQQDERVARREPLRRLLSEVSPTLMDERVRGAMRTALNRRLATVVLDTFPLRDRGDDVPTASRLRDAIAFVEEHARERPSVPAIAAAAGLSERGLQEVFARTLGVTPNGFLRDQRLDEVRRELLRGESPNSVLEVARRWRFTNPSRFATAYRARFGEDPSVTLRAATSQRPDGRSSWRIRQAVAYIENHLDDVCTVADIAAAAGLRPRRLQQLFKEERGTTPTAFLRDLRALRRSGDRS